jgi:hypothetical protein
VAGALASAGQHQQVSTASRAEAIARSITDPVSRAAALARVAGALASAGQHQRAEAVARSITSPDLQASALAKVAAAMASAGQHQRAETVARSITSPDLQANALAEVAMAMAQTDSAARMAAATCAAGNWTTAVRPVLMLAPSAFTTLIRILKAHQEMGH